VSACRSLLAVAFTLSALAGCSSDDDDAPTAEPGGQARTFQEHPAPDEQGSSPAPAQRRRPARLLLLGNFDSPTYITAPRGDRRRRFVVQREGSIVVVRGGRRSTFLDISDRVSTGGESGLLSMAFARDYRRSGRFYVYYTDTQGFIQIDQFRRSGDPNRADPASRRSVLRVPHSRFNHKGGQLQIGPDGLLYAGFGDGGGGGDPDENAQNLGRILGKLIRIAPRPNGGYDIPASNPFRERSGARGEVYAYGLRNPYRFSFDRRRGHLTVGDVGQDEIEEVDFVPGRGGGRQPPGGYNFGWDVFEGRDGYEGGRALGHVPPVIAHSQDGGYCSIIGGYVIRDPSLRGSRFFGRYVYGDLCNPTLRLAFLKRPSAPTRSTGLRVENLVSFGEDGRGRVYAVSLSGPVYRIGRG
jgi:glucose/arabinose dehydrogenase